MLNQIVAGAALLGVCVSSNAFADDEKKDTKQNRVEIRVESRSSSSDKDGKKDAGVTTKGSIVIVGEDGEKKVYDLNGEIPDEIKDKLSFRFFDRSNRPGRLGSDATMWFKDDDAAEEEPRYMIGVACEKVNELLERHLRLDGYGLAITSVSEGLPAAKADLAEGDILLKVEGRKLDSLQVLVKAVTESEGNPLTFTVLKKGEEMDVKITPKKATEALALGRDGVGGAVLRGRLTEPGKGGRFQLRQFGPGFRIGSSNKAQIGEAMKMLQGLEGIQGIEGLDRLQQLQDLEIAIPELDVDVEVEDALQNAEQVNRALEKELKVMQQRLAAMEKALKRLAEKTDDKE